MYFYEKYDIIQYMIIKAKWRGVRKKTSIGRRWIKTSSMNKNKRASFKKYRGQG